MEHRSVLAAEIVEWLHLRPGAVVMDGTVGGAGHARLLLESVRGHARLLGFDRDEHALARAKAQLKEFGNNSMLIHGDYSGFFQHLADAKIDAFDAMLLDLGVSSFQLDSADRGFSFRQDGPLDMRLDKRQTLTAEAVVNQTSEEKFRQILWDYGEERFARSIAKKIADVRRVRRIQTTGELASLVSQAVPGFYRHGRTHPATRTFQAIRIVVNDELGSLKSFLSQAPDFLRACGRVAIISFHSLEDRLVKTAFRKYQSEKLGSVLTKKPVTAGEAECVQNPRARSAKLRVFERRQEERS